MLAFHLKRKTSTILKQIFFIIVFHIFSITWVFAFLVSLRAPSNYCGNWFFVFAVVIHLVTTGIQLRGNETKGRNSWFRKKKCILLNRCQNDCKFSGDETHRARKKKREKSFLTFDLNEYSRFKYKQHFCIAFGIETDR